MGVQTSEVGYTSATTGRWDHEVHKGHVVAIGVGDIIPGTEITGQYCHTRLTSSHVFHAAICNCMEFKGHRNFMAPIQNVQNKFDVLLTVHHSDVIR
jgi:hypothetical protein